MKVIIPPPDEGTDARIVYEFFRQSKRTQIHQAAKHLCETKRKEYSQTRGEYKTAANVLAKYGRKLGEKQSRSAYEFCGTRDDKLEEVRSSLADVQSELERLGQRESELLQREAHLLEEEKVRADLELADIRSKIAMMSPESKKKILEALQ